MKNFIKNKKNIIILSFLLLILIYIIIGVTSLPIEQIYPVVGVGYDYDNAGNFNVPITVYTYKGENEIISKTLIGSASNIGETRDDRQLKMDKAFKLGCERCVIVSEKQAGYGIYNILNILFANPDINDRVIVAVCKDKAEDILKYKIAGYASSAEFIESMIRNSTSFNFLSTEYNLLNTYVKAITEGQNITLPYIEIDSQGINYSGMAIFNKDKMIYVLKGNESKILNILRENDVSGILTIQETCDKYVDYSANVRRKVICNKKEDKYEFIIDLSCSGDIIVNDLYKEISKKEKKEIEEKLKEKIEAMCNDFIKKMQKEVKVDCLQLGNNAAAKYGRDTGVDWNKVVSNSYIKVKANVKVDKIGRGEY